MNWWNDQKIKNITAEAQSAQRNLSLFLFAEGTKRNIQSVFRHSRFVCFDFSSQKIKTRILTSANFAPLR